MAPEPQTAPGTAPEKIEPYAWYVLGTLMFVYILNFVDRQMLTIFAADLKRDLKIGDGEFGFLYGTAFGVFYALFGIPLGKLADRWHRVRLLSAGLAVWSAMTALSGLAQSLGQLALARIGVGVGEASASPSAYSLISDYFPPRRRATALSIYSAGLYLGGGVSLGLGSAIAGYWTKAYPAGNAPFDLAGWQVAFLMIGLPGIAVAGWTLTLREPKRGRFDQRPAAAAAADGWTLAGELSSIIPPFTLFSAFAAGRAAFGANVLGALIIAAAAWLLTVVIGDPAQWIALGIGAYAIFSWYQSLARRDPIAYRSIARSTPFICLTVGYGLIAFLAYANSAFGPSFAMSQFGAGQTQTAVLVGGLGALGGATGIISGGALADNLARNGAERRRVQVVMGALLCYLPFSALMLTTRSLPVFYASIFPMWFCSSAALGGASGAIVNLVPPEVRGTATAAFLLGGTFLGLAMGPYTAGHLSDWFGSLRLGLGTINLIAPVSLLFLWIAFRTIESPPQRSME